MNDKNQSNPLRMELANSKIPNERLIRRKEAENQVSAKFTP